MQPCSREMQAMNSLLNPRQDLQTQQNQIQASHHFDPSSSSNGEFFEQMLSTIPSCSWADLKSPWVDLNPTPNLTMPINNNNNNNNSKLRDLSDETATDNVGFHNFDESAILASKLRQHQISGGGGSGGQASAAAKMMLQQQLMMASQGGEGLYNGFSGVGSMQGTNRTQQHLGGAMQPQSFGAPGSVMNQPQPSGGSSGGAATAPAPAQPKQRVRAKRGKATDPHSIAERLRRERIAERMKALQELVPNGNKSDKASMLDEIIEYVKFLQLQVKVLSMSRLGGAAAVAPLVAHMPSEGGRGGDCIRANSNGGSLPNQTPSSNDSLTVTEHQVAKLMEGDMGSAMQYLQGKGLCLMPISLATAISTATCHKRNSVINNTAATNNNNVSNHHHALLQTNGEGPSSPSMSVLTVQSATMGNGVADASVKDAASVSKP